MVCGELSLPYVCLVHFAGHCLEIEHVLVVVTQTYLQHLTVNHPELHLDSVDKILEYNGNGDPRHLRHWSKTGEGCAVVDV